MNILSTDKFIEKLNKRHNNKEITLEDVGYKILCYHKFLKTVKRIFNIIHYH